MTDLVLDKRNYEQCSFSQMKYGLQNVGT